MKILETLIEKVRKCLIKEKRAEFRVPNLMEIPPESLVKRSKDEISKKVATSRMQGEEPDNSGGVTYFSKVTDLPAAHTSQEFERTHEAIHIAQKTVYQKYGKRAYRNFIEILNNQLPYHARKTIKQYIIDEFNYSNNSKIASEIVPYLSSILVDGHHKSRFNNWFSIEIRKLALKTKSKEDPVDYLEQIAVDGKRPDGLNPMLVSWTSSELLDMNINWKNIGFSETGDIKQKVVRQMDNLLKQGWKKVIRKAQSLKPNDLK